jgi:CDP-glycerol glycerophosphotransferase
MKISVIIPFHRGEAYLRDCLDSLKEQKGMDASDLKLEILLVCDHVQENEYKHLIKASDRLSILTYKLKGKTGVAAARNLGLSKATGDYVYFLDSDDYLYDDTIAVLSQAALQQGVDIIYGKKQNTWFGRSIFFTQEKETEDTEDDDSGSPEETLNSEDDSEEDRKRKDAAEADETDPPILEDKEPDEIRKQAYRLLVAKKKGIRNISVLHILFKRSLIETHHIFFSENLVYFSDVPFLLEAMSKTERFLYVPEARYIKRKHNDSIHFPSLSQMKDPMRFYDFLDTYYETIIRITEDSELRQLFDKKYITYYTNVYAPKLRRSKNDIWREENFDCMKDILSHAHTEVLRELKGYRRRIINALLSEKRKTSIRIVTIHLGYLKLKKIMKNKKVLLMYLYHHYFTKWPLKEKWILFESFFGKSYSDSPKYIYEHLSRNFPGKYRMIWVIDKKNTTIPYPHKRIRRFSLWYYYYLGRCGYIVFNCRQPEWVIKRENNVFLQTWHGTPLKKLVFDLDEIVSASPRYKQQFYKQSRAWDYLIAPNEFSSETFRRCFAYDNIMLETGYPRNDILHAPDKDKIAVGIRKRLGIALNKKTILYAPTWRDDVYYGKGQYKFELHLDLELMRRQLGEEYIILLRTHYFIADSINLEAMKGFAYNVSRYDDISELYLISDILITDYSSVFFDYANLKRPMLFFTYDLDKYRDILRGFYFDIEKEVPGPLLYTTDEVIEAIRGIETVNREYRQRYDEFYHRFCDWEDGHAAEKVVKSVFEDD